MSLTVDLGHDALAGGAAKDIAAQSARDQGDHHGRANNQQKPA